MVPTSRAHTRLLVDDQGSCTQQLPQSRHQGGAVLGLHVHQYALGQHQRGILGPQTGLLQLPQHSICLPQIHGQQAVAVGQDGPQACGTLLADGAAVQSPGPWHGGGAIVAGVCR